MLLKHSFVATIENAGNGGAFVRIPFDVEEAFGSKRPKVKAAIDGIPYRGSLVRMGTECHILGVLKEIRGKIGKDVGDEVAVVIEPDTAPRVVEIPPDLMDALKRDAKARAAFEGMSYSHKREYVESIMEAKKPETRARRLRHTIDMLKRNT